MINLGTEETLRAINPEQLRRAHELGYSRNRCALFVSGDIDQHEMLDTIAPHIERLPDRGLSPRHGACGIRRTPDLASRPDDGG